ncbi:MAG: tRNA 2-thiouridine(34) synthase MnmA [Planctomycetes bacterium]|nr:tRNA 2-thiouridine(34) synthase MnmA [Planctomycetota bacterium]
MSGGVDSSVAAALLVREGYDVVGCFMRLGSPGETLDELIPAEEACASSPGKIKIGHQGCCSITDAADARQVAAQLGIPLYVCNFKKDFGRIIDYFADEYAAGRTPNPCVRCNDWLKFGKLHDYARQIGAEKVASGHYARIEASEDGSSRLMRGLDHSKDQSYVLFGAPRDRLGSMMFPIGGLPKPRVRDLARDFGFFLHDKPDSQEICFVPDNDYASLVEKRRPGLARRGDVVDESGVKVGEHDGQHRFTIGQRRGLDISLGHRVYVVAKDAQSNTVTIGSSQSLLCGSCGVSEANWLVNPPAGALNVLAKFRYNTPAAPALVTTLPDAASPGPSGRRGRFHIRFAQPQTAVAAGQALVMYDAQEPDVVVGGGWIDSVERSR